MDVLPTKADIEIMQYSISQQLEDFGESNKTFKEQFGTHLEIIRRYDEVLSTKASKDKIYELELKIKRELEPKLHSLLTSLTQQGAEISQHKS
jgi:hypothetical protein